MSAEAWAAAAVFDVILLAWFRSLPREVLERLLFEFSCAD